MEMKGEYFDEIFGVQGDADDEIFTSHPNLLQYSEYPPACWSNSCTMQQTITTNVASSSASASASACQLIHVESKKPIPVLQEESLVSSVDRAASAFHDQFVISPNYGLSANNLSSNTILNFSSPAVLVADVSMMNNIKNQYEYGLGTNGKHSWNRVNNGSVPGRSRLQAREHLVAERKRREKLGQLFINLSKLVPGIKKLDKASILEDAIDYIKILEERIRSLEIEQAKKCSEPDDHLDDSPFRQSSNIDRSTNEVSAIEVKIMDRNVLIKMSCKKQKGFMSRIHMEMEKMNFWEEDIRVMPCGSNALDITILAQMQSECSCSTVKDIVEQLEKAFLNPPHHDMQHN